MSGGGALYPAHLHAAHSSSAIAPSSGPSQSHPSSNSARLASSTDPRRRAGSTQTGSVNGNPTATTAHRICSSTTVGEERWAEVTSAGEQDEYGAGPAWGRPAVRRARFPALTPISLVNSDRSVRVPAVCRDRRLAIHHWEVGNRLPPPITSRW